MNKIKKLGFKNKIIILIITLNIAACAPSYNSTFDSGLVSPFSKINVVVGDTRLRIKLQVNMLSGFQKDKIHNFLGKFKNHSVIKKIVIAMPVAEKSNRSFSIVEEQIIQIIKEQKIKSSQVNWKYYAASPEIIPEIVMTYSRYIKHVNGCSEEGYSPSEWLGCATYQNIIAMVDNPRDLITPREMTDVQARRAIQALNVK